MEDKERNTSAVEPQGAKGYHQSGSSGFQQAFFPRGSCSGSNAVTFATTNSKCAWKTHAWTDDDGGIQKG